MSNPADCTIGDSVPLYKCTKQVYNMVKYESLSVYQIKNVKSCWLYYRWLKKYNMVKYTVQVKKIQHG